MSTTEEIQTMLADVEARESKLSTWERTFVDSVSTQFGRTGTLSPAQDEKLEQIWNRITS